MLSPMNFPLYIGSHMLCPIHFVRHILSHTLSLHILLYIGSYTLNPHRFYTLCSIHELPIALNVVSCTLAPSIRQTPKYCPSLCLYIASYALSSSHTLPAIHCPHKSTIHRLLYVVPYTSPHTHCVLYVLPIRWLYAVFYTSSPMPVLYIIFYINSHISTPIRSLPCRPPYIPSNTSSPPTHHPPYITFHIPFPYIDSYTPPPIHHVLDAAP